RLILPVRAASCSIPPESLFFGLYDCPTRRVKRSVTDVENAAENQRNKESLSTNGCRFSAPSFWALLYGPPSSRCGQPFRGGRSRLRCLGSFPFLLRQYRLLFWPP